MEQLAAIIMLNAGGTIDLLEFLQPREDLTVYVLDSHRPLNLHNLFVHDKVRIAIVVVNLLSL